MRLKSIISARDVFVLIGFMLLYSGIAHFSHPVAMIVVGAIILIKGLIKWA